MSDIRFSSIEEALAGPTNRLFWVAYADGRATCGHEDSYYAEKIPDKYLTFDVSNNKVLANLSLNGAVRHLAIYRDSYPIDDLAPGIWWHKDFSQSGPYAYAIELGGRRFDLGEVDWPLKMSLLGSVFPLTQQTGPGVEVTLIAFAPISADGQHRPRGLFYGLLLRNTSPSSIKGKVFLPKSAPSTYVTIADGIESSDGVAFQLAPNETLWTPTVIAALPGEATMAEIARFSSLEWLNQTWAYFQRMLGELDLPDDPFMAEFFKRTALQCFNSIAMNERGDVVGANWSGYPATPQVWMKDMYHACVPLAAHEPTLLTRCVLWFLDRSVRFKGDKIYEGYPLTGGISHSLTNSLAPVVLSGIYFAATGDREFFQAHPEVLDKIKQLLDAVFESREGEPCLFPSAWLSDGPSRGDYHTGSNVVAWYAFQSAADIIEDVLGDTDLAERYRAIAAKTKQDIDRRCITEGPLGPQYTEGANADGSHEIGHDGEETDTTLMPFYGYCAYDNEAHQNHARVAMTEANRWYRAGTRGIKDSTWISEPEPTIDATYPGYMTGLAGVQNADEMSGPDGRMTVIRRLTDVDGSIWWWPYKAGEVVRAYEIDGGLVGKSGWASGVYAAHFVSQILGLSYDGRTRTLRFRPFSPTSHFTWKRLRLGHGAFSVEFARDAGRIRGRVENHNDHDVTVELELILGPTAKLDSLLVDGKAYPGSVEEGRFFDSATAKITIELSGNAAAVIEAAS